IDDALQAIHDNHSGQLSEHFHPLQGLVPNKKSTKDWIMEHLGREAIANFMHQFASDNKLLAPQSTEVHIRHLTQAGPLLRAYSFEERKHSIVSRLCRWLSLSA